MEKSLNLNYILSNFPIDGEVANISEFGNGYINQTYKVQTSKNTYILQSINSFVFPNTKQIFDNIKVLISELGSDENPIIIPLIPTLEGSKLYFVDESKIFWRLLPFVDGVLSLERITKKWQAYEASIQYGRFTRTFTNLDTSKIKEVIPDFHNGIVRFKQLKKSINKATEERLLEADKLINSAFKFKSIIEEMNDLIKFNKIPIRVIHGDTKLNNVLMDKNKKKGSFVIDLDTIMPGTFLYDFGDLVRTCCNVSEEGEKDKRKVQFEHKYFAEICKGFSLELKTILTPEEKEKLLLGVMFMTYMMAIRFLTDFLNNDVYYKTSYSNENFIRSRNQFKFLEILFSDKKKINKTIRQFF